MRLNLYAKKVDRNGVKYETVTVGPLTLETWEGFGNTYIYINKLEPEGLGGLTEIARVNDIVDFKWVDADITISNDTVTYNVQCDRFKVTATMKDDYVHYKVSTDDIYRIIEMTLCNGKVSVTDKTMY